MTIKTTIKTVLIAYLYFSILPVMAGTQDTKTEGRAPQAEDVVVFKKDTFACFSKDEYKEFKSHINKMEQSLAQAMLNDYTCILVPTDQKYKVVRTEYNAMSRSFIQFTTVVKPDPKHGYWTDPVNVEEIKTK